MSMTKVRLKIAAAALVFATAVFIGSFAPSVWATESVSDITVATDVEVQEPEDTSEVVVVEEITDTEVVVEETQEAPVVTLDVEPSSVAQGSVQQQSPELDSDKDDYAPSDTVTIWGKFFQGLQNIVLKIVGGVGSTYHEFVQYITTDEEGSFTAQQELDGVYRPEYTATAYDEDGNALASVDFTDAAVGGYDQCSNDDGDGYATGDTGCRWTNGNLQSNNSTYFEGDSTVQRLWLDGLIPGATHTITFQYGTTKQGKHAYDYLTTWNHSENWLTIEDRCQGITGCTTASETSLDIPQDPNVPDGFEPSAPGDRQFKMRGGILNSATTPVLASGVYSSDSETEITVNFTVGPNNGDMCVTKQGTTTCSIAIWFGAHISVTDDWVPVDGGTGATTIPGSPYHVALSALDGGSVGNRDNQMQAGAIQANATIVIVKDAIPNGPQDFSFITSGTGLSNFSLDDDADGTLPNTQTFTGLVTGQYSVTEDTLGGWNLTNINCVDPTTNTVVNLGTRTANIDLAAGETVTCTFTNQLATGRIIVDKVTDPSQDTQSFDFTTSGSGYNSFSLTDQAAPNDQELLAGNYSVSETLPAGWDQTSATCVSSILDTETPGSLELDPGETITCTFTNTKRGHLIVQKTTVPASDTTEFSILASGSGTITGGGAGTITDALDKDYEVTPGTYSVAETVPSGWTKTGDTCQNVVVAAGETKYCEITNTKKANIIVKKVMVGGTDTFNFTGSPSGSVSVNEGTIQAEVAPGQYISTESAKAGWDLTAVVCDDGASASPSVGNAGARTATFNAEAGETVTCTFTNTKRGHIIVDKVTNPGNDPQSFSFDAQGGVYADFALTDQAAPNDQGLVPGNYVVTENQPTGWDLTSLVCVDPTTNTTVDVNTASASINLAAGETVTCTFTNTKRGTIVVVKDAVPNDDQDFTFQNNFGNGHPASFMLDDDGNSGNTLPKQRAFEVIPGNGYMVSEDATPGWKLYSATCDKGESVGSITVEPGETVTCTFVNHKLAKIILVKNTVGGDGDFHFNMTGDTLPASAHLTTVAGTDSEEFNNIDPDNEYSIAEVVPDGWDLTSASCTGTNTPASITPNNGETVTCTFTNTKRGSITIEKQTLPDGSSETFDFTGDVAGTLSDNGSKTQEVVPGSYSSTETVPSGWDLTSIVCDDNDSTGNIGTATASFVVAPGEDVTCVFTNTQRGKIVVDKVTNPTSDPQSFDFATTGSGYGSFSLADASAPNEQEVVPGAYTVAETPVTGWDLTSAVCDRGETPQSLDVEPGETVTCTFTNTKRGKIIVVKQTEPDAAVKSFDFTSDYGDPFSLSDGQSNDSGFLVPGTYAVSEDGEQGWYLTSATCDDGSEPASIELTAGETVTCTFVNVEIQDLVVSKTADTTFTRTYDWTIEKTVTPETWNLFSGDSGTSEYTVTVTKTGYEDSAFEVSGTITIQNPNTDSDLYATISSVADVVTNSGSMSVDCGVSFPYELAAGDELVCTYSGSLQDGEDDLNTATVSTTGLVPGGQGTADVTFGDPELEINDKVNVTDTVEGDLGEFSDTGSVTYERTFTCDTDKGEHGNTATIVETGANDSASVTVNCYDLEVTKDVSTDFDRTYDWNIEKSVDKNSLTLAPDQVYTVNYTVRVEMTGSEDSNFAAAGKITVHNPAPVDAVINNVADVISGPVVASVECGEVFPYTLAAGASLECAYTAALPDGSERTNTATATLQNYDYDSEEVAVEDGTTDYTGTAQVDFAQASIEEIDECVEVVDSLKGVLGTVCNTDSLKEFNYTWDVGPYSQELCGVPQRVDNTATLVTNDTATSDSDSEIVNVNVACVCSLTQGYWKTHNGTFHGGAPSDPNWFNFLPAGEDAIFYLSNKTWFEVFWTAPKGNVYYNLAHQYMAAKLNVGNGAWGPSVTQALLDAEALFNQYTPAEILALKGKKATDLKKQFTDLAGILGAFNEGLTNPAGHCTEPPAPQQ